MLSLWKSAQLLLSSQSEHVASHSNKALNDVHLQQEQQRREKEEDAREQARLQAEQERLKQQFAEEKEAEKAKRAAESGVRLVKTQESCFPLCINHSIGKSEVCLVPDCLSGRFCRFGAQCCQRQLPLLMLVQDIF